MILRRFMQHVKEQNWFAVALDILVVIVGIFLGMQVTEWNDERIEIAENKMILNNIHYEFINNQEIIRESIRANTEAFNASIELINLVGADETTIMQNNLDKLFNSSLMAEFYFPTTNSLDDILQSGRMKLINDEKLKSTIMEWVALLQQMKAYKEVQTNWQNNHYVPYLLNNTSFRQMEIYNNKSWAGKSKLTINYLHNFQDLKFENIVDNNLWLLENTIEQLKKLQDIQAEIIKHTKPVFEVE